MKSITNFIIVPDKDRKLTSVTESGFYLHTMMGDEEEGRFLNRIAVVTHVPLDNRTPIKVGDRVIVQHNVFRQWLDYGGNLKHSNVLDDGSFFVRPDLIYAYEQDGFWNSVPGWIFINPTVHKQDTLVKAREEFRPDKGVVVFTPMEDDVAVGDFISYKIGKYIPTLVDGVEYYRVLHKHILVNHGKI